MRLRIAFESPVRVVVCTEPSWFARLLSYLWPTVEMLQPVVRFADCLGWQREWCWSINGRPVPEHVAEAIERAWCTTTWAERRLLEEIATYETELEQYGN